MAKCLQFLVIYCQSKRFFGDTIQTRCCLKKLFETKIRSMDSNYPAQDQQPLGKFIPLLFSSKRLANLLFCIFCTNQKPQKISCSSFPTLYLKSIDRTIMHRIFAYYCIIIEITRIDYKEKIKRKKIKNQHVASLIDRLIETFFA